METQQILITAKTYPTLSETYGELVCTAGMREDGSWVRLYPVPFRRLGQKERYRKFDWIEAVTLRNTSDPRPESHRLVDPDNIRIVGHFGTEQGWAERRQLMLGRGEVFEDLQVLIDDAHANRRSLATFRPTRILDIKSDPGERLWPPDRIAALRARSDQGELFSEEGWRETFELAQPLPWKFSCRFKDCKGKERTMQILDWEAGALYWNCLRQARGDEAEAVEQVKSKYRGFVEGTDLHFLPGTSLAFHNRKAPNPWMIIGVVPFPRVLQRSLF